MTYHPHSSALVGSDELHGDNRYQPQEGGVMRQTWVVPRKKPFVPLEMKGFLCALSTQTGFRLEISTAVQSWPKRRTLAMASTRKVGLL